MLKKLQALKAKKGFTLVELIVVIAIIAVLAAILVPTLMGQVTKSRITQADSGAASIKDTLNTWLMNHDVAGYDQISSTSITLSASNGVVTVNGAPSDDYKPDLKTFIEDSIEMQTSFAEAYIEKGKVVAVAYVIGKTAAHTTWPDADDFETGTFTWKGDEDGQIGITSDGVVIGTSPKLPHA